MPYVTARAGRHAACGVGLCQATRRRPSLQLNFVEKSIWRVFGPYCPSIVLLPAARFANSHCSHRLRLAASLLLTRAKTTHLSHPLTESRELRRAPSPSPVYTALIQSHHTPRCSRSAGDEQQLPFLGRRETCQGLPLSSTRHPCLLCTRRQHHAPQQNFERAPEDVR